MSKEQRKMRNEELEMRNEKRKMKNEKNRGSLVRGIFTLFIFHFSLFTCMSCASGGSGGSSGSAARRHFRDTPVVVKAAFDTIDPVFRRNLKPNASIAVFPISTSYNLEDAEELYEQLQINVVNSGRYTIVEKRHVDQLLQEHDFQRSGMVADDSLISFGKLLGADAVILGSVTGRGSNRDLSLIAVDMEKRATLATADEPWPQSSTRDNTKAAISENMGMGNVLFLPVVGGSKEENDTLANLFLKLRDINDACNLIDESAKTNLLPANFTGFSAEDNALLYRLGLQYKVNYIIYANVQKYGQRNLAIISRYNVFGKKTDNVYYLEYLDPVEAWVKLPGVISTIMKGHADSSAGSNLYNLSRTTAASVDNYLWVQYRDGVDRAFAQRMLSLLITDFTEASGKVMQDITDDIEEQIEMKQGVEKYSSGVARVVDIDYTDWKAYMNTLLNDLRTGKKMDAYRINLETLFYDMGFRREDASKIMIIEASRQGNKTRFQLLGAPFAYSLDFSDMRDFVRQVRGMSLSINSKKATAGYDLGIVQGVKYNYWKYAEEDSTIPDILTYTKPYPSIPNISVESRSSTKIMLYNEETANILYYYSTENNFSKATPIYPRIRQRWSTGYMSGKSESIQKWHELYGLNPDTRYFIWATNCWGYLTWLQGEPKLIQTRTTGGW
jgi:hypothetical protein